MEKASQHFSDIVLVKATKKFKKKCVENFLRLSKLKANEVQKKIDNIGISRDAYNQIFQMVQSKLKGAKAKTKIFS